MTDSDSTPQSPGELLPDERHPTAVTAWRWLQALPDETIDKAEAAIMDVALDGDRGGEILMETMRRFREKESMGERYALALCWVILFGLDNPTGTG